MQLSQVVDRRSPTVEFNLAGRPTKRRIKHLTQPSVHINLRLLKQTRRPLCGLLSDKRIVEQRQRLRRRVAHVAPPSWNLDIT